MKPLELDELPRWSAWPARLLGLAPWTPPRRDVEKVRREYDADKYGACLAFAERAAAAVTADDVKRFELGGPDGREICVSHGERLWAVPLDEARRSFLALLAGSMREAIENSASVVELGCGYGANLWALRGLFPGKSFVGGELSRNAVRLARMLYAGLPDLRVEPFNFVDPHDYALLSTVPRPVTLFTSHALEQLPAAEGVLDALAAHRDAILSVFHFEPLYREGDGSLLAAMRRRYTEANDYNRDLADALERRAGRIRVLRAEADVLGLNPLNPTSVVQWEFER